MIDAGRLDGQQRVRAWGASVAREKKCGSQARGRAADGEERPRGDRAWQEVGRQGVVAPTIGPDLTDRCAERGKGRDVVH